MRSPEWEPLKDFLLAVRMKSIENIVYPRYTLSQNGQPVLIVNVDYERGIVAAIDQVLKIEEQLKNTEGAGA
jgi:hypothetical protein